MSALAFLIPFLISYSVLCYNTVAPTWLTSPLTRADSQAVIAALTDNTHTPSHTFTFSASFTNTPNLAYSIKRYRGYDTFSPENFEIRRTALTASTFTVQIQIIGATQIYTLDVAYLAIEPTFPHHLNTFDNVAFNYSSGPFVFFAQIQTNISVASPTTTYFTQIINYTQQAIGRSYNTFNSSISDYRIVLFLTNLGIEATWGEPVAIAITTSIVNITHYSWTVSVEKEVVIEGLRFSQVIFDEVQITNSGLYHIEYAEWINNASVNFRAVPEELVENFIMGITDFSASDGDCGFQYQWFFVNASGGNPFGIDMEKSETVSGNCGLSLHRSSLLYMMTWDCLNSYPFFNVTSRLCQDDCASGYFPDTSTNTCVIQPPCHYACLNCTRYTVNESLCLTCDTALGFLLGTIDCVCPTGYTDNGTECEEVCGDGIVNTTECDDGNLGSGDGCSNVCKIETGYTCVGLSPSVCSYPNITVQRFTKNSNANKATISLSVNPLTAQIASNLTSLLSLDFPHSNLILSMDNITGTVLLTFDYSQSLITHFPLSVTWNTTSNSTKVALPLRTTNGLSLNYYDQSVYSIRGQMEYAVNVTTYVAIGIFVIGFVTGKLVPVEMMLVFQMTFCHLALFEQLSPLMETLKGLQFTNGYNELGKNQNNNSIIPVRFSHLGYSSSFVQNFNFTTLLLIAPIAIGLSLQLIGAIASSQKIKGWAKRVFKQWFLCCFLFVEVQLCASVVLFLRYGSGTFEFVYGGLVLTPLLIILVVFCKFPDGFGQFKSFFHLSSSSQLWYSFLLILRVTLPLPIFLLDASDISFYILFGLYLLWLAIQLALRPYSYNIRPAFNILCKILITGAFFYLHVEYDSDSDIVAYGPIAIYSILVFNLLAAIFCTISHCCTGHSQDDSHIDDSQVVSLEEQRQDTHDMIKPSDHIASSRLKDIDLACKLTPSNTTYRNFNDITPQLVTIDEDEFPQLQFTHRRTNRTESTRRTGRQEDSSAALAHTMTRRKDDMLINLEFAHQKEAQEVEVIDLPRRKVSPQKRKKRGNVLQVHIEQEQS